MGKLKNPVQMAVIGAAHGIKGEVRVKSFTDDPMSLGQYGALYDDRSRVFQIENIRPQKDMLVVRFKNITTRNDAELLNGLPLFIERDQLPDDLEEEEFYQTDLIGLIVRDEAGADFAVVSGFFNFGAGDLLEIKIKGKKPVFIPFTKAAVPHIDVQAGFMTMDKTAAGLVDLDDETGKDQEESGMI